MIEIGIAHNHRQYISEILFSVLSNYYILMMKTQNYHWNIQGHHFMNYHAMFSDQYDDLTKAIDEMAERIRHIGLLVQANYRSYSEHATLKEESAEPRAETMITNLLHDHEFLVREIRSSLQKIKETEDEGTIDFLIQRMKVHEKTAWMLRSHLDLNSNA